MTLWNDMIIGICLLLLVWLLWKESRRPNRSRLPARMAASILTVISLACLALPPSYMRKKDRISSSKEGVLLTGGYDPDSLRQFLRTARVGGAGAIPGGEIPVFPVVNGEFEPQSFDGISRLSKLHVFGYGLTRKEWTFLHPPPLVFHPSPPHSGILSVSWKQKLGPGEKLRIQGSVQLTPGRPTKLLLTGMGIPLDSVIISAGAFAGAPAGQQRKDQADFELSAIPAQIGRSVFRLFVLSGPDGPAAVHNNALPAGTDTLEQESLPIEVLPGKKLQILLLAASPDFENTFLVNWLARSGHAVAARTAISKGKLNKAYLNMPETVLDPLTPSVLDKFDITIADAAVLQTGSATELFNLRREVAEKGMGLIIKADSAAAGSGGSGSPGDVANASGAGSPSGAAFYKDLFPLGTTKDSTQRLYIKEKSGTQALLRDSNSRMVVSSGIYGSGKLVFTTLNTTYYRMLSGEKKEYAAYWSLVLRTAARESKAGEDWQVAPDLPRVNEPAEALLQTNKNGLPQGEFAGPTYGYGADSASKNGAAPSPRTVYLAQAPLLPFLWQGTYWPAGAGWQSSATLQGDTTWWYAWSGSDWPNITRRQRWKETEAYIAERATAEDSAAASPAALPPPDEQGAGRKRVPVSPGWFYALFFLSCLFLWVERKI